MNQIKMRSMINLTLIDFVWALPFTSSHGIIFLIYLSVKTEEGQDMDNYKAN